jgi:hypothetical protein
MPDVPSFPILTSGALSAPELREHVARKLERALGRIGGRVQRVETRCSDVNGPRGGVDQLCRLEFSLRGLPPIVVEKRAETARQAFDRAVNAAKRALRRTHERSGKSAAQRSRRGAGAVDTAPVAARAGAEASLSTARRNLKRNVARMAVKLEDSATGRPSRKSTRKSANRARRDTALRLRAEREALAPKRRARKAQARSRAPKRR